MDNERETDLPPPKRQKVEEESSNSADATGNRIDFTEDDFATDEKFVVDDKYKNFVTPEELAKLKEFKVLDEVKSNDEEDSNDGDSDSDGMSEGLPEEEIEQMLDENLPEDFKGTRKPKEKPYVTRTKIFLEEKGINQFEILPLDWMKVRHCSGMPIYIHRSARVCTLAKPYFIGKGNARRHDVPISAIPCFAYRRALDEEIKQAEIDRLVEEQIKNKSWLRSRGYVLKKIPTQKENVPKTYKTMKKNFVRSIRPAGKCPYSFSKIKNNKDSKELNETITRPDQESTHDQQNKQADENIELPTLDMIKVEKDEWVPEGGIAQKGVTGEMSELDLTGETGEADEAGEVGEMGEADEAGEVGEMGEADEAGEVGEMGEADEAGEVGKMSEMGDMDQTDEPGEVEETVETGEAGEVGETGEMSDVGETGEAEEAGEVEEAGVTEKVDETAETGDVNEAGEALAGARTVLLPDGRVMPAPRVESADTSWKTQHLTPEQIHDYCKKLFKFKTVNFLHFNRWADRRKYTKARKALQYPKLPEGTKLITIPATNSGQESGPGGKTKRDWVMNMNGCSYLSEFHEYVCRALQKQPVYEYKQLENATTPYQATVYIGGMQYGVGHGSSKRQAKYAAARASIQTLIPEMRQHLQTEPGAPAKEPKEPDFSFFDYVGIEDPRIAEFCAATCEPSPHSILLTCLLRNFGAGDWHVNTEVKKLEYQKIELTMRVGKHSATVVCKNKKTAKQRASQAILQALHPHVRSWGSLLRLYGSRSVKSCKEKKLEEQQITLLQDKARHNEPNYAVLEKLRNEMHKLRERDESVVPIGTLLLADHLPSHSASNLNNVDL